MVVSVVEWESLQETLAVLSDPHAVANLREAEASRAAGEVYTTKKSWLIVRLDGRPAPDQGAIPCFQHKVNLIATARPEVGQPGPNATPTDLLA